MSGMTSQSVNATNYWLVNFVHAFACIIVIKCGGELRMKSPLVRFDGTHHMPLNQNYKYIDSDKYIIIETNVSIIIKILLSIFL